MHILVFVYYIYASQLTKNTNPRTNPNLYPNPNHNSNANRPLLILTNPYQNLKINKRSLIRSSRNV